MRLIPVLLLLFAFPTVAKAQPDWQRKLWATNARNAAIRYMQLRMHLRHEVRDIRWNVMWLEREWGCPGVDNSWYEQWQAAMRNYDDAMRIYKTGFQYWHQAESHYAAGQWFYAETYFKSAVSTWDYANNWFISVPCKGTFQMIWDAFYLQPLHGDPPAHPIQCEDYGCPHGDDDHSLWNSEQEVADSEIEEE